MALRDYKEQLVQELIKYPTNSRTHSEEQINQIVASIKEFGFTNPLLIDEHNSIIAGHGRLEAAIRLGLDKVPCVVLDGLTKAQKIAYVIADNKLALNAGWDFGVLRDEFDKLKDSDFNLELTGFGLEELCELFPDDEPEVFCGDDECPGVTEEPTVKLGDVWLLGDHRLMCGDSTLIDAVEKLMDGAKADMVFTDPPYGINYQGHYSTDGGKEVGRKNLKVNEFEVLENDHVQLNLNDIILTPFFYCKEIFIWGVQNFTNSLPVSTWICWDRKLTESADKSLSGDFDLCWSKTKHKMRMYRVTWHGVFGHSSKDDGHKKLHPTMKPVKLIELMLNDYSKNNQIIVDLFGGSGSTLIACEKLGRKCYMMELDPKYCDVIIKRYENYTGKKAILEANHGHT